MEVPIEEHGREEDEGTEGPQQEGYFRFPDHAEAPVEKGEADEHEEQVEGEELPAGRQEGVSTSL